MQRLLLAVLVLGSLAPPLRAEPVAPPPDAAPATLPESSRWLSFVRLVDARWRVRTTVLETDREGVARLYDQCVEDAWQLALDTLLVGKGAPCAKLAVPLKEKRRRGSPRVRRRDDPTAAFEREFDRALVSPTRERFRACTAAAALAGDARLLATCGLALEARHKVIVSLDDAHRFGNWMDACKRSIIGEQPAPAGEKTAAVAPPRADVDDHARHCLRVMPTLYEIQWLKKLSDFWTPAEQRALYARGRQLGESVD